MAEQGHTATVVLRDASASSLAHESDDGEEDCAFTDAFARFDTQATERVAAMLLDAEQTLDAVGASVHAQAGVVTSGSSGTAETAIGPDASGFSGAQRYQHLGGVELTHRTADLTDWARCFPQMRVCGRTVAAASGGAVDPGSVRATRSKCTADASVGAGASGGGAAHGAEVGARAGILAPAHAAWDSTAAAEIGLFRPLVLRRAHARAGCPCGEDVLEERGHPSNRASAARASGEGAEELSVLGVSLRPRTQRVAGGEGGVGAMSPIGEDGVWLAWHGDVEEELVAVDVVKPNLSPAPFVAPHPAWTLLSLSSIT
eukprot:g2534.t1